MKPTEVKLVTALLDQEWEDVDDLAAAIITSIDEKREKDDKPHVVIQSYPIGGQNYVVQVHGPFPTPIQAQKFTGRLSSPGPEPGHYAIKALRNPKEVV